MCGAERAAVQLDKCSKGLIQATEYEPKNLALKHLVRFFHKPSYFWIRQVINKQKLNSALRIKHSELLAAFGG